MTVFVLAKAALWPRWPSRSVCMTTNGPLKTGLLGREKSFLDVKFSTEFFAVN